MNIQKFGTNLSKEVDFFQELPRSSLADGLVNRSNSTMMPYFQAMQLQKECDPHLNPFELIEFAEKSRSKTTRGRYSYVSDLGVLIRIRACPADQEVYLLTADALYVRQLATLCTPGHEFRYPNHTL